MNVRRSMLAVVALTIRALLLGSAANAQTAACCYMTDYRSCDTLACDILTRADCEGLGGDWLGNLQPDPVFDCSGTPGPCETGSCCVGPDYECRDNDGAKMTCEECKDIYYDLQYRGGLTCDYVSCTVCDFEDVDHCQRADHERDYSADRAYGMIPADDFRAPLGGGTINHICYWHGYVVPQSGSSCHQYPPDDDLSIRFYEDAFGLPGTELPNSPGESAAWDARLLQGRYDSWDSGPLWQYSAPIDPGVNVDSEACYWIEITGVGRPDCEVRWAWSVEGNDYRVVDDGFDGAVEWGYEDLADGDTAFCIDIGITPGTTYMGDGGCGDLEVACCLRDGTCSEGTRHTCWDDGGVFFPIGVGYPYEDCADVECPRPPNDNCEDNDPSMNICAKTCVSADPTLSSHMTCVTNGDCSEWETCEDLAPSPDNGYCANADQADDGPVCSLAWRDCYDTSPCREWRAGDVYRCKATTDNRLATTDGPLPIGNCYDGQDSFQADVWYKIAAPCTGEMVVDMCSSEWESYEDLLAVFGDHTENPSCPGTSNDDFLRCSDAFCWNHSAGFQIGVVQDAVYLLRLGGWSYGGTPGTSSQGRSEFNIGFMCPTLEPPGLPADPVHQAPKNRYISVDLSSNGYTRMVYRLTLLEMNRCAADTRRACNLDADCADICAGNHDIECSTDAQCGPFGPCLSSGPCVEHDDVGITWRIGDPSASTCQPLDDCSGEWFAPVTSSTSYRVWTEDVVHITGCEIVPAAVYQIRGTPDGIHFTESLTISTIDKPHLQYGDVCGPMEAGAFTAPDGFVNVTDVQAYLIAGQGGATAPHTTWVDLHGVSSTGICEPPDVGCIIPQQILNVSDLQTIKFGFLGQTYVETPGQQDPGDCP